MKNNTISIIVPTRNAAARTCETVDRYLEAAGTTGHTIEVVIVDDGSRDSERTKLQAMRDPRVRVIVNERNTGRGGAINAGARLARGAWLLIIDCDCPPANVEFFAEHLKPLVNDAKVSIGALLSRNDGFWSRYQDRAVRRRERQFAAGIPYAFTSQNVFMEAELFRQVDGFDDAYKHYGFEDRDFFIRLAATGASIVYTRRAGVIHDDDSICLATIAPKMRNAGEFTSSRFRLDHQDAYQALGYAAIDSCSHPWLRPIGLALGPRALAAAPWLDRWLERMPFGLACAVTKAIAALTFMYGTTRSNP